MDSDNQIPQQGPALGVSDVLYILFRHKWKVVFFALLGIAAATGVWVVKKPLYESSAKIWVRYVAERRGVNATGGEADVVREVEVRGLAVVNSEVEILTSVDSVLAAVHAIGAGRVLQAYGGGTNEHQAAGVLLGRLKPTVGSSGVVTIELGHPDPEIAREALSQIISAYRKTHLRIHRSTEAYDDLQSEADRIRTSLARTEDQLRTAKGEVNVIALDDTKQELATEIASLRSSIFGAEAELAERRAQLEMAEKTHGAGAVAIVTNSTGSSAVETNYPPEKLESYRVLAGRLGVLQKRAEELTLGSFSETSRPVQQVRQQIADVEKAIEELGIDPAKLNQIARALPIASGAPDSRQTETETLRFQVLGLQARITELTKQRQDVHAQLKKIEESEDTIRQLERRRASEEDKLRKYESNIDKARVDQAIDSSKLTNITVVQEPTPAGRNMLKLYKMMGMALFGMIGAGIALGFVIDMFLDTSLKRPKDVEAKARIPLFVSIPRFGVNGRPRLKLSRKMLSNGHADTSGLVKAGEVAPWETADPMFEYYESLRDRVVMSYEGDPHKPKIVAVTSCNRGAGTTRIATGLAASLSRDVQRRVLYIGLEKDKVSVTAFQKGRPEAESTREDFDELASAAEPVAPELYSLVRTGHNLQGASIVQSFSDMIPNLRKCEFDYIIFDLPPVSETSGSLRLASQMERTLLIIESEQTPKAKVDRVRELLSGTGTKMFAVLNKTRSYGPQFLAEQA